MNILKNSITVPLAAFAVLLTVTAVLWAAEPAGEGRKAWQHLALTHNPGRGEEPAKLAGQINTLGEKGWELVAVTHAPRDGTTGTTVYYFKRPL